MKRKGLKSDRKLKELAKIPYRFGEVRQRGIDSAIIVPRVSSELEIIFQWIFISQCIVSNQHLLLMMLTMEYSHIASRHTGLGQQQFVEE